ncbi:MAG: hypothetical protein A4E28_02488 [Methanocella sp. PtaU1.Bin125]|nr:MAG: hypothetical protein A4E28_02488 [Methanocella sp. PtaU1.Bin125]
MKIIDRTEVKIEKLGDRVGFFLPVEYEELEGFPAGFEVASDKGELVLLVRPQIERPVKETIGELWRDLRQLYSELADIGEQPPWQDIDIVWGVEAAPAEKAFGEKVPIAASEVLEHRRIYHSRPVEWDKIDIRKSIFDTLTKLCGLASRRLGFESRLFSAAFGDAVANKFCQVACTYGTLDVICEIVSEEFNNVYPDRYWSLTSGRSREAVAACYRKVKYLEDHPEEFEKERARIQGKWGFPLQSR